MQRCLVDGIDVELAIARHAPEIDGLGRNQNTFEAV